MASGTIVLSCSALSIFLGSFLLFSVQPMVGKMVLPLFGGVPSVWNVCMVFFQAMLLLGYLYAHLAVQRLGPIRQAGFHLPLMVLPLAILPISVVPATVYQGLFSPSFRLLEGLLLAAGLPVFLIAANAPLVQRWFASTDHPDARDPYFLYAVSNGGSLLALLAYPLFFEPRLDLAQQSRAWSFGYAVLLLSTGLLVAGLMPRAKWELAGRNSGETGPGGGPRSWKETLFWVYSSFIPSSLLLGVTSHITTNLASIPLLWVLPLSLYLMTFIAVFSRKEILPHSLITRMIPFFVVPVTAFFYLKSRQHEILLVGLHLLLFFMVSMSCHGVLARKRPEAERLTEYYLWIGVGGVLGGLFNTFLAPVIFDRVLEYPLVVALSCTLLPVLETGRNEKRERYKDALLPLLLALFVIMTVRMSESAGLGSLRLRFALFFAPAALATFSFKGRPFRFALSVLVLLLATGHFVEAREGKALLRMRNFFGSKHVTEVEPEGIRYLYHGTTVHGSQFTDAGRQDQPLTYYHRSGPLGDVFRVVGEAEISRSVAAVGLGAGAASAFSTEGSSYVFYEIDPQIQRIASDPEVFSYLNRMKGDFEVILGDGRLAMRGAPRDAYGIIILDAFSSDAIPVHLLTLEAVELYLSRLREDGLLVFHISNRFVDFGPLMAGLSRELGLVAMIKKDQEEGNPDHMQGKYPSDYVVMGRAGSVVGEFREVPGWYELARGEAAVLWTDKYSNVLRLLKL